jgi:hypothetical protein
MHDLESVLTVATTPTETIVKSADQDSVEMQHPVDVSQSAIREDAQIVIKLEHRRATNELDSVTASQMLKAEDASNVAMDHLDCLRQMNLDAQNVSVQEKPDRAQLEFSIEMNFPSSSLMKQIFSL